jgi:hypothetical protein
MITESERRRRQAALKYATASVALEGLAPGVESNRLAALHVNGAITFEQMLNLEGVARVAGKDEHATADSGSNERTTTIQQAKPASSTSTTVQERMLETAKRLGNDPIYRDRLKHLLF